MQIPHPPSNDIGRRRFLIGATGSLFAATIGTRLTNAAAAASPSVAPQKGAIEPQVDRASAALADQDRVGFALVGLGRLSLGQLIPAFASCQKAKLTGLVSGHPEKAQKLAREHGINPDSIYSYENFDRIGDNPNIRVVYIVLPNNMHGEFTVRAARAGKHVLCEKPMEVSSAKCQEMIDACARADVQLMIAYRIQYEPMNRFMQKAVRDKVYGVPRFIHSINAQNVGKQEWRLSRELSGSGAVGDVGVYCINTIRFLLGEEPFEVFAQSFRPPDDPRFKEVDATTSFELRFPSGVLASCTSSFDAHDTKSYRVIADRGTFGMEPAFSYSGLQMHANPNEPPLPAIGQTNHFALEMDHMAECVVQKRKPYTPGEEGLQDQRIIEAILSSANSGSLVKLKTPPAATLDAFRGPPPS